ncbi:hypothetical protein SAY86_031842 [Trapa natans]|uniref:BHLH domain-containing protein n=1 Tax=Trapa natans TaxID=22666 RepID=A0AAN7LUV2_TRANT|nr:hypothetical protein SAY86_031842 [Trapa natans]
MDRAVFQNSSPVQPIMAGGNPNWWWNPPLSAPPHIPMAVTAPASLFPELLYVPTAAGTSSSLLDINNPELPEPWSLLLGGFVGEDHGSGNYRTSNFQEQQSPNDPPALHHVKQENSRSIYFDLYGHPNDQQYFQFCNHSPVAPVNSSSARSCTSSIETNDVLDFSNRRPSTRCDSCASGGPQKKAKVQPSSNCKQVRKEKLGDRIIALHQLVSPFGKTDTASVLSEAIAYIRFLHGQVQALSTPYLGSRASGYPARQPINHHEEDGEKSMDMRSRGLCLVPVSCTDELGSQTNIGSVDYLAAPSFGNAGISYQY